MKSFKVIAKIKIQDKDGVWHKFKEDSIVSLVIGEKSKNGFEVKRL